MERIVFLRARVYLFNDHRRATHYLTTLKQLLIKSYELNHFQLFYFIFKKSILIKFDSFALNNH